ncbi:MAG: ABC transporter ATP-binding protein [Alphaproteobacteria bacterium]|nr:ABC transporter ATP-binding protein [Alphaproteobacteria bacterium]
MGETMIRLSDVRFRWRRTDPLVLDIARLEVASGEKIFIKGRSGSGKTTLLNLLGGVASPESGAVSILGTDLAALSGAQRDAFRADHIGFIFQMFNLVPYLSLIDNVTLPCRFSAARRRQALDRAETLEDAARDMLLRMELDVDALSGRPVSRLSMGQQQRVAAARSLIGAPDLIIADEPTSAIDAELREAFIDLLFQEARAAEATLVFVSHDAALESHFDRTIALADINRADLEG